jgi:hypothetical protein
LTVVLTYLSNKTLALNHPFVSPHFIKTTVRTV